MSRVWGRAKDGARKASDYRAVQVVVGILVAALVFVGGFFAGDLSNQSTISDLETEVDDLTADVERLADEKRTLEADVREAELERDDALGELERVTGAEELIEADVGEGVRMVGRGNTLNLEEMEITLVDHEVQETITTSIGTERASGTFVTITLRVMNKLNSPQPPHDYDAFLLLANGNEYSANFDAMNLPGQSFTWESDDIQPGTERTGTVTFDVPADVASDLEDAVLLVPQFSDSDFRSDPALPIAGLRLE